jgi:hypothetical protein
MEDIDLTGHVHIERKAVVVVSRDMQLQKEVVVDIADHRTARLMQDGVVVSRFHNPDLLHTAAALAAVVEARNLQESGKKLERADRHLHMPDPEEVAETHTSGHAYDSGRVAVEALLDSAILDGGPVEAVVAHISCIACPLLLEDVVVLCPVLVVREGRSGGLWVGSSTGGAVANPVRSETALDDTLKAPKVDVGGCWEVVRCLMAELGSSTLAA